MTICILKSVMFISTMMHIATNMNIKNKFVSQPHPHQSHFHWVPDYDNKLNAPWGTSLVAQWLRIHLPMQGTWVWSLVGEEPTCHGATKPVRHNYWAWALETTSHNYRARMPQLLSPCTATTGLTCLEPMLRNKRSHLNEKPVHGNEE